MRSTIAMIALAATFLVLPASAQAQIAQSPNDPSSTELVEEPKRYDGTQLTFAGEAIYEVMVRGDMAWLHLNDDAYHLENVEEGAVLGGYNSGMAVWIAADLARKIEVYGDYKHQGDVVEVEGVFNAACAEHGGDMDIHATALRVVTEGRRALDPVKPGKIVVIVVLAVLATVLWFAERHATSTLERGIVTRKRA